MAKQITIVHEDKKYTLEFSRESVRRMESDGFVMQDFVSKPMTMLPLLFAGAFLKNHRFLDESKIDEIYKSLSDKKGLISKLIEMYEEPLETLTEEPKKGNSKWEASW